MLVMVEPTEVPWRERANRWASATQGHWYQIIVTGHTHSFLFLCLVLALYIQTQHSEWGRRHGRVDGGIVRSRPCP